MKITGTTVALAVGAFLAWKWYSESEPSAEDPNALTADERAAMGRANAAEQLWMDELADQEPLDDLATSGGVKGVGAYGLDGCHCQVKGVYGSPAVYNSPAVYGLAGVYS